MMRAYCIDRKFRKAVSEIDVDECHNAYDQLVKGRKPEYLISMTPYIGHYPYMCWKYIGYLTLTKKETIEFEKRNKGYTATSDGYGTFFIMKKEEELH